MNGKIKYDFVATLWQHSTTGAWRFVSLPNELSKEIRSSLKSEEEGWGRLKAIAKVGATEWKTAIWFDTKKDTYLLPIKATIRKKENIEVGMEIKATIYL